MTTRRKRVAQRTCVICRQTRPKRELTRLVRTPDAGVQIDLTGKQAGRGAYLCDNPDCWEKASKSNLLNQALRATLNEKERELIIAHGAQLAPKNESES